MKLRTTFDQNDVDKYFLTYQISEDSTTYISFVMIFHVDEGGVPSFEDAIPHYTTLRNHIIFEDYGEGTFIYGERTFPTFLVYQLTEDEILSHVLVENI